MKRIVLSLLLLTWTASFANGAEDRRERVLQDRQQVNELGSWIYDDFPEAAEQAKKSGKPLLVVFRCVP